MKFLVDMPISPDAARWLIEKGHDATHASDVGLDRAPDLKVLEAARIEDRIVVTADLDYPRLLAITRAEAPGLILFRGGNYTDAEIIDGLSRVFASIDRTLLWHSIVVVEKTRIRRRPIPNPVILHRPRRPHKWCNRHIHEHERRQQRKLLIRDEPVVVHCYTTPDDIEAGSNLAELGRFCRKMGRDAHEGEIGLVIGNEYFAIHDFEE